MMRPDKKKDAAPVEGDEMAAALKAAKEKS
jgi:hypothetical protein